MKSLLVCDSVTDFFHRTLFLKSIPVRVGDGTSPVHGGAALHGVPTLPFTNEPLADAWVAARALQARAEPCAGCAGFPCMFGLPPAPGHWTGRGGRPRRSTLALPACRAGHLVTSARSLLLLLWTDNTVQGFCPFCRGAVFFLLTSRSSPSGFDLSVLRVTVSSFCGIFC